ncbi:unnamed protein product [Macrosiphum euphorbiae]|uniref:Uncharacterized protein n=1 Tax=Macrosiphum euphorbiae TaxID=13131 RepID=A0AAV0WDJ6_9HEMI|nr:unnamed protein product [Macrosiphum euphorbiae]
MACDSNFHNGYGMALSILKKRWLCDSEMIDFTGMEIFSYFETKDDTHKDTWDRALSNVCPTKVDYTSEIVSVSDFDTSLMFLQPVRITDWDKLQRYEKEDKERRRRRKKKRKELDEQDPELNDVDMETAFHRYLMKRTNNECHVSIVDLGL